MGKHVMLYAVPNLTFPAQSCQRRKGAAASWSRRYLFLLFIALCLLGCTTSRPVDASATRPFNFQKDTFAYANELVWEYHFDARGKWVSQSRQPKPDYTHHCFVVARSARQFFEYARFDPARPIVNNETYRQLIHQVISIDPRHHVTDAKKIVIPGYPDLRSFSEAQEQLLQTECGGAWQSYFQRGHWRMIMPFSRHQQQRTANQLIAALKQNHPPVVHLVRFPQLTINHAVVLFDVAETEKEIQFAVYDPNQPKLPAQLTYDRASRTFHFPYNDYFPGGRVDVYEVYRNLVF
jgi:hypothetical protein